MSPDSTDKHQVGIIDMVRAVVNVQRKGPCTFLDLLLLHLDNLQSSFQITGLKKKIKNELQHLSQKQSIQILIGFNLA